MATFDSNKNSLIDPQKQTMKNIIIGFLTVSTILIASCNSGTEKNNKAAHETDSVKSMEQHATANDKDIKAVTVAYLNLDARAAASINKIVDSYLQIKNALANDNGGDAADGGKAMAETISKLDKSLLTAEQKKAYDQISDDLKEDAEHIGKNGDNIKHQREHFVTMSEEVYDLVKNFGAGSPVYHDHCPMANDNQGAMWISEMKEIKNPYLGKGMPTCGSVEEIIK